MFAHRFGAMLRCLRIWTSVCAMLLCVAAAPVRSYSQTVAPAAYSVGTYHVWIYNSQNVAVDVTDTLVLGSDGYWYATLDGNTFPIVINSQEGHVYDLDANLIGYTTSG